MKLISLNCAVRHISDKRDLQRKYPDRFEGIGKFPGKHPLVVREDAQPVVHSPRRTPIHLTEKLHEELKHMEDLDVIRKVSEPTDWVSSIALSRKSNGHLRVCLDPRDLNKALKRTIHRTPTLEEITFKLSGAQVFSKSDARHGYWSVVLDDESSLLTTFNSPDGRFCYKRLPFALNVSQDIFQAKMDVIIDQCTFIYLFIYFTYVYRVVHVSICWFTTQPCAAEKCTITTVKSIQNNINTVKNTRRYRD